MKKTLLRLALTIYIITCFIYSGFSQIDTNPSIDSSLINITLKEVIKETKKGLSREQISLTIIISIAGSILAIILYQIRSIRRAKREAKENSL